MALIKCCECGSSVSDRAEKCPQCGCPVSNILEEDNKKKNRTKRNILFAGIGSLIVIIIIIAVIISADSIEIIDYSGELGTSFNEIENLKVDKAPWYINSENPDAELYSGKKSMDYLELQGELEYRCFNVPKDGLGANDIYLVGWQARSSENAEALISSKQREKIIHAYDKRYGEHEESDVDVGNNTGIQYTWELPEQKRLDITIYNNNRYLSLRWMYMN